MFMLRENISLLDKHCYLFCSHAKTPCQIIIAIITKIMLLLFPIRISLYSEIVIAF